MERMSPRVSIDRDAVSAFCQRHHITRLALFGSVLREDFGPDSVYVGAMLDMAKKAVNKTNGLSRHR